MVGSPVLSGFAVARSVSLHAQVPQPLSPGARARLTLASEERVAGTFMDRVGDSVLMQVKGLAGIEGRSVPLGTVRGIAAGVGGDDWRPATIGGWHPVVATWSGGARFSVRIPLRDSDPASRGAQYLLRLANPGRFPVIVSARLLRSERDYRFGRHVRRWRALCPRPRR